MAAVQDGQIEPESEKEIKSEALNDATGNHADAVGGLLPSSPVSTASVGASNSSKAATSEDQQTLLAVLQFLKRNKLVESADILRREAGLLEEPDDTQGSEGGRDELGGASADEGGDTASLFSRVTSATGASGIATGPAPSKGTVK